MKDKKKMQTIRKKKNCEHLSHCESTRKRRLKKQDFQRRHTSRQHLGHSLMWAQQKEDMVTELTVWQMWHQLHSSLKRTMFSFSLLGVHRTWSFKIKKQISEPKDSYGFWGLRGRPDFRKKKIRITNLLIKRCQD